MVDQLTAARERLNEASLQLRGLQTAWQTAQQNLNQATRKAAELEAEMKRQAIERPAPRVGAVLTANNSVKKSLPLPELPGIEVRQENELIRIELPSDRLFRAGSADLLPESFAIVDQVAAAIARNYPRQIVGIEGYWDNSPVGGAEQGALAASPSAAPNSIPHAPSPFRSAHQLTGSQALTLFDQLTMRNRLPSRQLHIMGLGSNHPRVSNATQSGQAKNRRIEFVIYPETYDGL
jgi:flagellar motor protein MotB